MKISVIIPSYNRAHTLHRALASIFKQKGIKGSEMEVIVVDDGSIDSTAELISQNFPQVVYLHQDNMGVSAARNRGLEAATGEWIAFLDSDDEWLQHKLSQQLDLLTQTGLLICHTEEQWIRNGVRVNQMRKHCKHGGYIFQHCLPLCAMSPSSIIIHSTVFDAVGNFDEALPACEDYDLWLRITSRYEVAFVSDACINKYGGHQDQLSRQHWGMDRFRVIALQKLLEQEHSEPNLSAQDKRLTITVLLKKLKILRNGALKHNNDDLVAYCDRALQLWNFEIT